MIGMQMKMILAILLLGAVTCRPNGLVDPKETPLQPQCPPGSYDASEEGSPPSCLPCPPGYYNDEYNVFRSCKKHRDCSSLEEDVLFPGTATSNVVCKCKQGGRDYYNLDDEYGYDCRQCKEGSVTQAVARNAIDEGDTACCPSNTTAVRNEAGDLECRAKQASTTPPAQTPTSPKGDLTQSYDRMRLIVGFACLITGVFLGVASTAMFIRLRKRSRRAKRSSKANPPIFKVGYNRTSTDMPT